MPRFSKNLLYLGQDFFEPCRNFKLSVFISLKARYRFPPACMSLQSSFSSTLPKNCTGNILFSAVISAIHSVPDFASSSSKTVSSIFLETRDNALLSEAIIYCCFMYLTHSLVFPVGRGLYLFLSAYFKIINYGEGITRNRTLAARTHNIWQ